MNVIAALEFLVIIALAYSIVVHREQLEKYKSGLAALKSEYLAFAEHNRRSVGQYTERIAALEKFITDIPEDAEAEADPSAPVPSIALPENAANLIQRLKQRHTARIAAYDFEQQKTDAANAKLGRMYRDLQCSSSQAISTLRSQLDSKLRVKCPVCTHIYQAPDPVIRLRKAKGVIQSVPTKAVSHVPSLRRHKKVAS